MEGNTTELGTWLILCSLSFPLFGLFYLVRVLFRLFSLATLIYYHGEWGTKEISRDEALKIALEGLPMPETNGKSTYELAREFAVRGLKKSIKFHEQGNFWGVMFLSDEFDNFKDSENYQSEYMGAAFTLWDCWYDAIAHDWHHYPAVKAEDWPRLAEELANNIENDQPITNPLILNPNSKP